MVSDKIVLGSVAILSIAAVETVALTMGYDGIVLTGSVAAIVGLVSYLFGRQSPPLEALPKVKHQ